MANKYDVYKCNECGNVVMMLNPGECPLECRGHEMVRMEEQTADSSTEKHVPIIEKVNGGYKVTVGSTLHPMLENHWIQWIELVVDGQRMFKELGPNDAPEAFFCCACEKENCSCHKPKSIYAREYCNLHGLWKGEL